jgi:hypothetical protein
MCLVFSRRRFEITILGCPPRCFDEAGTILYSQFEVVLFLFKCIVSKMKSETLNILSLSQSLTPRVSLYKLKPRSLKLAT